MSHVLVKLILLIFHYLCSYSFAFWLNRNTRSEDDIFYVPKRLWRTILINGFILAIALGLSDILRR